MTLPTQTDPQFKLRIPRALHGEIVLAAARNNRSINAEIVTRIEGTHSTTPLTGAHLADALGCFWNAAIGAAHNRQTTAAMDAASVMAEGFAAVADRLAESPPVQPDEMRAALVDAERFIRGFEDDEGQEGIGELLATIRKAMGGAA